MTGFLFVSAVIIRVLEGIEQATPFKVTVESLLMYVVALIVTGVAETSKPAPVALGTFCQTLPVLICH